MKKLIMLIILMTMTLFMSNCQNGKLIFGVYRLTEGESMIESFEIKEGVIELQFNETLMNAKLYFSYEIKGKLMLVNDRGSIVPFEIINSKTIKCEYPLFKGIYKKK